MMGMGMCIAERERDFVRFSNLAPKTLDIYQQIGIRTVVGYNQLTTGISQD